MLAGKDKGRTSSLIVSSCLFIVVNVYHYLAYNQITIGEILISIILGVMTWYLILQYNKVKFCSQQYDCIFNLNQNAVYIQDLNGDFLRVNPACEDLTGYTKEELLNMNYKDLVIDEDIDKTIKHIGHVLNSEGQPQSYECNIVHKNGKHIKLNARTIPLIIDGELIGIYGTSTDITEHRKMEERINYMAHHDALTDLPNRYLANKKLNEALLTAENNQEKVAVLFLDLNNFKMINDTIGHDAGDLALQKAAKRLNECIREDDIVARLGGDEFIIIMQDINKNQVDAMAQKIINDYRSPFIIEDYELFISINIGISIYPDNADNVKDLINYADIAMYSNKKDKGNNYKFYSAPLNKELSRKNELKNELRKALKNDEFYLKYQPQIHLFTGEIIGVEALIRWQHSKFGEVSPGEFIPIAEEIGLISSIDNWVLKTAARQNKAWQEAGLSPICMSVNVSRQQLHSRNFIDNLEQTLKEIKLDPKYLEIEIIERGTKDLCGLNPILGDLKNIGVKIAIDDFGTGYSSLSILDQIPLNKLKVDQSFIQNTNVNKATITKTIINMAINLNLDVTAEGIETVEQLDFLKRNKCHFAQGYLFAHPLLAEKIEELLNRSRILHKAL